MLIALLSDIHGNREALDACLDHAGRMRADRYVFLGDYVGYGADPGSVLNTVRTYVARGAVALKGNHDEAAMDGRGLGMNPLARAAIAWTHGQIDPEGGAFLQGLPLAHREGERLFVHANACAPGEWGYVFEAIEAERSMRCTDARLTFCGHTHVPAVFHQPRGRPACAFRPVACAGVPLLPGRKWLAVIGSVGQPRDGDPAACYALLHHERNVLTYIRVPYDVETAAQKILDAGLPSPLAARLFGGC